MKRLTDLELCKRIAEIENLMFDDGGRYFRCMVLKNGEVYKYYKYNPLIGKALIWDLCDKYFVSIDREQCIVSTYLSFQLTKVNFLVNSDIPRAILECIIETYGK